MKVTAVVVTYNRLELLKENIAALQKQTYSDLKVLVVDNCSADGTKEYLENLKGDCMETLYLNENLGGAGGFYYGMKKAYENGADAVWIMDDDTIPNPDSLEQLVSAYDEIQSSGCECGYLASDVRWIDGSECIMNRVHFISGECLNYKKISTATFVSLLIPRDTIAKVGLPIKEYFIWGDDKEYTLRISDALPCFFVPSSTVLHKMKSNVGSNICTDELDRIGRYFYAFRNDYATAKKRGLRELLVYYMGFYLNFCRVIFKSKNGKRERLNIMQSGKKAGKHFLPQIERV